MIVAICMVLIGVIAIVGYCALGVVSARRIEALRAVSTRQIEFGSKQWMWRAVMVRYNRIDSVIYYGMAALVMMVAAAPMVLG